MLLLLSFFCKRAAVNMAAPAGQMQHFGAGCKKRQNFCGAKLILLLVHAFTTEHDGIGITQHCVFQSTQQTHRFPQLGGAFDL